MTATTIAPELSIRLDSVIQDETATFLGRQRRSEELSGRATALAGGATSSWQVAEPHAVWLSHGNGSKLYDVDGNEYSDFHGGYGVSLAGHNHPAIVAAVRDRVAKGTHFAQPTEDSIVVADNLAERYHQPLWRFGNSGTEATMDAVHLMRAYTGRERIIKLEGGYHGHHDSVMVSVQPESVGDLGPVQAPNGIAENSGLLKATVDGTVIVPANNLPAVESALARYPGEIAGMILEPIMMNAGIIYPDDGYLESLKELLHTHGALLTFDEVKTGFTVGPGGASGRLGVTSDLVCVAKAMGGGLSTSAIGGGAVMELVASGEYQQVGTFNGNPLAMAAARAMLTDVLTDDAYTHLDHLRDRMRAGLQGVIDRHDAPWVVVTAGAKGCVSFMPDRIRNFRDFRSLDGRYGHAHWLVQHNRGAFLPPWGKVEQWLMSVQHTDEDVDTFVSNFSYLADQLLGGTGLMAGALSLTGLVKTFGDEVAVDGLDLEIGEGEFFSLLGSSGCGKTTTLRMVAGFEQPDAGQILLDGQDLATVSPHKRPVNTVFQSYALFPFMDVADNVAFGLKYQRVSKGDVRRRVGAALDLVQMGSMSKRKPHQLSGGQQQRVALARALVLEPTVLLLDEPMGALDAKLRKQLQIELRALQKQVGTTFIYVTHDQDEALTMSDRLAVLDKGKVKQVGTPSEVYSSPANTHVATFLGTANLWPATVTGADQEGVTCSVGGLTLRVAGHVAGAGDEVSVMVRPERVEVAATQSDAVGANQLKGRVTTLTFRGAHTNVLLECADLRLEAQVANLAGSPPEWLGEGADVAVQISPKALRVLLD